MSAEDSTDLRISSFVPAQRERPESAQLNLTHQVVPCQTAPTANQEPAIQTKQQLKVRKELLKVKKDLKSCLASSADRSTAASAKTNSKKKTVAFGRTVDVSQTIEGNSRVARQRSFGQLFAEHKTGLQMDLVGGKEDKENSQQNDYKQENEVLERVLKEFTEMKMLMRQQSEESQRKIDELQGNFEELSKDSKGQEERAAAGWSSSDETTTSDRSDRTVVLKHRQRNIFDSEKITILEARYLEDPIAKQCMDDWFQDHKYNVQKQQADMSRNLDSPFISSTSSSTAGTPSSAPFRAAASRSVRPVTEGVEYSIDSRRFIARIAHANRAQDRFEDLPKSRPLPSVGVSRKETCPEQADQLQQLPVSLYQSASNAYFDEETPLDDGLSDLDETRNRTQNGTMRGRRKGLTSEQEEAIRQEIRNKYRRK
ncbi:hypothetical protein WR25_00857 [Diploscapter pachys]|uniref:Uncharacterized protein n=1 Tax=Diploscapter pachys TaxID=2018661 RepID=A0A2A2JSZ2_9BILA|nr:hypothetical protein WR25_00857 [Diploscapter pachys]